MFIKIKVVVNWFRIASLIMGLKVTVNESGIISMIHYTSGYELI